MAKYEDRLRRDAKVRFAIAAAIFAIVAVFVVLPSYQKLSKEQIQLRDLKTEIEKTESKLEADRDNYRELKEDYAYRAEVDQQAIAAALPENSEQTNIVREIEKYTNQLAGTNQAFILNSISFGKVIQKEEIDHLTLPFKMSLTATKENLMGLLRYLERSGSITSGAENAGRLFDIQDISIQMTDTAADKLGVITADLTINAYILPTQAQTTEADKKKVDSSKK
jgi:hypothetical protein